MLFPSQAGAWAIGLGHRDPGTCQGIQGFRDPGIQGAKACRAPELSGLKDRQSARTGMVGPEYE